MKIPKVTYLNKMDREGASIERSIDMMIQRLEAKPFIIQLPYGVGTFG
jgi:elongation factor G